MGRVPGWGPWEVQARAPFPPTESWTLSPQMMQTNVPGVFAAGDAVTFPLAWRNNRKVNIPHWQMAHAQGMTSPSAGQEWEAVLEFWPPPGPSLSCCPWVLAAGCRAIQSSGVACLGQPHPGDHQAGSQRKPCVWPISRDLPPLASGQPNQPATGPYPHLSFQQPRLFSYTQRHTFTRERKRDLVGCGSAPHSVPLSPLGHSIDSEPRGLMQTPGRWPPGPGDLGLSGELRALRGTDSPSPSL